MLKSLRLRNFKCFDDLTLDLSGPRGSPVGCALIYGENGSGKTNLVMALALLKAMMVTTGEERFHGLDLNSDSDWSPSSLKGMCASLRARGKPGPMALEFCFVVDGKDAVYEVEFSGYNLLSKEKLTYSINNRKAVLFDISNGKADIDNAFYGRFREEMAWDIAKRWGEHTLLSIICSKYNDINESFLRDMVEPGILRFMEYVKGLDVYLPHAKMTALGTSFNPGKGAVPKERESELDAMAEAMDDFFSGLYSDIEGASYTKSQNGWMLSYELVFKKRVEGRTVDIPYSEESSGTRKLVDEFMHIIKCVSGGIVIVDEMDSGIHDLLMLDVFKAIHGSMKGQLIATTHNTLLLQESNPREAFIIDMDGEGNRSMKSIHSIARTQKSNNNTKRYIQGDFGGVPVAGFVDLGDIAERLNSDLGERP